MSKKGTSHWVEGLVLVSRGVRLHPRLTSTQSESGAKNTTQRCCHGVPRGRRRLNTGGFHSSEGDISSRGGFNRTSQPAEEQ